MPKIEKSIEIDVPVHTVYNQWTQFEDFPRFMEGVKEVHQLDNKRLHWRADIAGKEKEWEAEIGEQTPDQRIAWHSVSGARNAGRVTFKPLGDQRTLVTLMLDYEPEGIMEKAGDALGVVSGRVQGDLQRFKEFIETRGSETGAWRGEIHGSEVKSNLTKKTNEFTNPATSSKAGTDAPRGSGPVDSPTRSGMGSGGVAGPTRGETGGVTPSRSGGLRTDPEERDDDTDPGSPGRRR